MGITKTLTRGKCEKNLPPFLFDIRDENEKLCRMTQKLTPCLPCLPPPPKKTKANQKTNIIFMNNDPNLPPLAETLDLPASV